MIISAIKNILEHVFWWTCKEIYAGYIPRSEISDLCKNMFSFYIHNFLALFY